MNKETEDLGYRMLLEHEIEKNKRGGGAHILRKEMNLGNASRILRS